MSDMIDERTISQPKITVYSTPTCPYCVMAKRYLSEKGIAYEDVNVAEDQKRAFEMLTKSGQMGVPVLDIGGQVIVGFDRHAIDDALMHRK
jgi:glutaredoxin-like YruB-family protein